METYLHIDSGQPILAHQQEDGSYLVRMPTGDVVVDQIRFESAFARPGDFPAL
jgi:hypothetical protein